ncbi:MAG: hypothetical protein KAT50_05315 [Pirellulales bacterium]|nr:hypothetical protein [Pirellulales bacterium]
MNEQQDPQAHSNRTTSVGRPTQSGTTAQDFYFENGLLVFTAAYHLKRGICCGSGCRHCPFEPSHVLGTRTVRQQKTA